MQNRGESSKKKQMLFLGLMHSADDTRLCRFLAKAIRARYPDVECLYLGRDSVDPIGRSNDHMKVIAMPRGMNPKKHRLRWHDVEALAAYIREKQIDLVQLSDVRELRVGYALRRFGDIPLIYDAHEDYFNQKYEYSGKSLPGLVRGSLARLEEILHVRRMDAVFCTDDYLEQLYRFPIFSAPPVAMVRNIPPRRMIRSTPIFHARNQLKLVYIGTVNQMRGIIEVADYCHRFNAEPTPVRGSMSLSFHVFSHPHKIVDDLVRDGRIVYHGYRSGADLETALQDFDVGVSTLLRLKKFERNIPIKNFEYMAAGLPILTSNFGTMKRYTAEADAGVFIDPADYRSFLEGILKLRDGDFRRARGENGIAYAKRHFRREVEVAPYLEMIGRLLGVQAIDFETA